MRLVTMPTVPSRVAISTSKNVPPRTLIERDSGQSSDSAVAVGRPLATVN